MQENMDQENSEYEHFSRSVIITEVECFPGDSGITYVMRFLLKVSWIRDGFEVERDSP